MRIAVLGGSKLTEFRVVVSGFDRSNEHLMPHSALKDAWLRRLYPLKKPIFIDKFGVPIMGIDLRHVPLLDDSNDFESLCIENGLGSPLTASVRFLVSDAVIRVLPTLSDAHDLLVAINLNKTRTWNAHPSNAAVVNIGLPAHEIKHAILDILLDLSFANSFSSQFFFNRTIRENGTLFRQKTIFALESYPELSNHLGLSTDCPYTSFSALSRSSERFGSDGHINNFIEVWDAFFHWLIDKFSIEPELATKQLCAYPKLGGQLSPSAVADCLADAPKGTYLFIARRRSFENASKNVQGRLKAVFSSLPFRGKGVRDFGLISTSALNGRANKTATQIERLANDGYLYVIRTYI